MPGMLCKADFILIYASQYNYMQTSHAVFSKRVVQGRVPERLRCLSRFSISSHFFHLIFYGLLRVKFCVIITVSKRGGSTVFCKLELHALRQQNCSA